MQPLPCEYFLCGVCVTKKEYALLVHALFCSTVRMVVDGAWSDRLEIPEATLSAMFVIRENYNFA